MPTNFPGDLDAFLNPNSSTNLDAQYSSPQLLHSNQHANLNDAVEAIEAKVGKNLSTSTTSIDFIVNYILLVGTSHLSGVKRKIIGGAFPTNIIWYYDSGETIKLVEKKYTYEANKTISKVELFLYDGTVSNVVLRTITDLVTFSGIFEVSRSRAIT